MPQLVNKKTIAVDVDDVLAANAKGFTDFSNARWGTKLQPDDYTEHWAELWKVEHDELLKRRQIVIDEKVHYQHEVFEEAKAVLQGLKNRYKLAIVSSRSQEIHKETFEWIDKEFPGVFEEIHFAKIYDDAGSSSREEVLKKLKQTKAEVLKEIDADYLIDDQPKHCIAAAEAGITSLLFGDYKWNRDIKLRPNMIRTKTWQDVKEYFDAQD